MKQVVLRLPEGYTTPDKANDDFIYGAVISGIKCLIMQERYKNGPFHCICLSVPGTTRHNKIECARKSLHELFNILLTKEGTTIYEFQNHKEFAKWLLED